MDNTFKDWVLGAEAMSCREAVRLAKMSMKYQSWRASLRLTWLQNIAEPVTEPTLLKVSHPLLALEALWIQLTMQTLEGGL